MVRLAALTTGSVAIAEEIVQDAFLQLHRNWERVDKPDAWLRMAVVNGCRDWVRRRGREPTSPTPAGGTFDTDNVEAMVVRAALGVLSPRQRIAVVLRYFEDLPEREIADLIGCRPGTVKSLLARSLPKLEKELRP
jgi:RNA polymerase sigma factor (sigma-70 family)